MKNKITVFTPTYNRAYILKSLFESLKRQNFTDFEWLIIDDGSTDDTEEMISKWIKEQKGFSIRYYRQENGGKCRAINKGVELARGELFLVVDSDDFLTDDALKKIDEWEQCLPKEQKYCGVSGNLGTTANATSNSLFDERYYDGTLLDRYHLVDGERAFAFYTEIHRQYKYPVFENEKFMTEAVVYNRMAHDGYKMRFFNDIICVYSYQEDGLTKAGNSLFLGNPRGYGLWLKEKVEYLEKRKCRKFRFWYAYYCEMSFCENKYRLSKKQIASYIDAPIVIIYFISILHKLKIIIKRNNK